MKLVFMGTPEFAVPSLEALVSSEHQVELVVSQPDRPQGRGYKLRPTPVKEVAVAQGLPVLQPTKLKEIREQLESLAPDAVIVVAFGQKIPQWLLELPRWGCINLHPSLLPKYRGAAPIQAAIANGDQVTGVCTMRLNEGWDTGPLLLCQEVPIHDGETAGELHDRLRVLGAQLVLATLAGLEKSEISPVEQDDQQATFAAKLSKEAARIRWDMSAFEIYNHIRANNPWPVAWTTYDGESIKIWQGKVGQVSAARVRPGEIIRADADGILVQTGNGILVIELLQRSGGRPLLADAFRRGYRLAEGTLFE